jgi:hypothetical protein
MFTSSLLFGLLMGCSPNPAGVYRENDLAGDEVTLWDFRSDGTVTREKKGGLLGATKLEGKWRHEKRKIIAEVVMTKPAGLMEGPATAEFQIEPNGDLIAIPGQGPIGKSVYLKAVRFIKQK